MSSHATETQREEDTAGHVSAGPKSHRRGLLLIGLFKLSKSVFFLLVGLGALQLMHKNIGNELMRLATGPLHRDPEGWLVSLIMQKADLINVQKLRLISFGTFAYSAIALVEGVGLMLEKVWAEYLTLSLTIAFLPWEVYELARDASWFRLGLLVINLLVLWYLVWLLRRKKGSAAR